MPNTSNEYMQRKGIGLAGICITLLGLIVALVATSGGSSPHEVSKIAYIMLSVGGGVCLIGLALTGYAINWRRCCRGRLDARDAFGREWRHADNAVNPAQQVATLQANQQMAAPTSATQIHQQLDLDMNAPNVVSSSASSSENHTATFHASSLPDVSLNQSCDVSDDESNNEDSASPHHVNLALTV